MPETKGYLAFSAAYHKHLTAQVKVHPDQFMKGSNTDIDDLHARMMAAFKRNSANKDSMAVKRTCKELGIGHTYKDIRAYIGAS